MNIREDIPYNAFINAPQMFWSNIDQAKGALYFFAAINPTFPIEDFSYKLKFIRDIEKCKDFEDIKEVFLLYFSDLAYG